MATNVIQSGWLRFLRKFGVAFFWAMVVGVGVGGLVYFRVDRLELERDPRWHVYPRLWLEELEAKTVDWRARQLGESEQRPDDVVLVNVDEETVVNGRVSSHPEWSMRPWPRALLGRVAEQAVHEGAAMVIIDESFADTSAHECAPCRNEARQSDDQRLGQSLSALGPKAVLGYTWRRDTRRSPDRPLAPVLLKVGEAESERAALPALQRVLSQRAPAYLVPTGATFVVWAGATNEAQGRALAAALELKAPPTRALTSADDALEVTADRWLTLAATITASGFDPDEAPVAGAFEPPVPELLGGAQLASMRLIPDSDGVVRSVPLLIQAGPSSVLPTLGVLTEPTPPSRVTVADRMLRVDERPAVPVDRHGFLLLKWSADEAGRTGRGTMKRAIPAWRLLVNGEDEAAGLGVRRHDNDLEGRIVVLSDERSTPRFDTAVGRLTRGAIWAQALTNVKRGEGISRVPADRDFWLTFAFAVVGAVLAVGWSSLVRRPGWLTWVATIVVVGAVHAFLARQLYVTQARQVVMVAPLVACSITLLASLGYARTLEASLREFMLRALGGAVRADVFRRVQRDLALMRPERRELTVFFSDIEGFTSVSNEREPKVVVDVLRQYLDAMTTVVLDHDGYVDKYLGDGLMAFWGAPVALPNDAEAACAAALDMHRQFDLNREKWESRCGRSLTLRAGLESGDAVVGEMGTLHRINYTVMGEPVASAARLEALAKQYGVRTLVGESLHDEAKDAFLFRYVDTLVLGRASQEVKVYELLGANTELARFDWLPRYHEAIDAVANGELERGRALLSALAEERPDDRVIQRRLESLTGSAQR